MACRRGRGEAATFLHSFLLPLLCSTFPHLRPADERRGGGRRLGRSVVQLGRRGGGGNFSSARGPTTTAASASSTFPGGAVPPLLFYHLATQSVAQGEICRARGRGWMVMGSRAFAAACYIMLPPAHPTCMGVFSHGGGEKTLCNSDHDPCTSF